MNQPLDDPRPPVPPVSVVFMRDTFTLSTTIIAAAVNAVAVALVLFVVTPRVDRAASEAHEAREAMESLRAETLENRRLTARTQEAIDRQWKELEGQRETVRRVNTILQMWEDAAKKKAAEAKKANKSPMEELLP